MRALPAEGAAQARWAVKSQPKEVAHHRYVCSPCASGASPRWPVKCVRACVRVLVLFCFAAGVLTAHHSFRVPTPRP